MKKIYCLALDGDCGELWLDENKKPLAHVDSNDAHFREEYQSFIIEYLGGELIQVFISDFDEEKFYDVCGDLDAMTKFFSKQIKKIK